MSTGTALATHKVKTIFNLLTIVYNALQGQTPTISWGKIKTKAFS